MVRRRISRNALKVGRYEVYEVYVVCEAGVEHPKYYQVLPYNVYKETILTFFLLRMPTIILVSPFIFIRNVMNLLPE